MFRRRRKRLYTEAEVAAICEAKIRETGARFTEILARSCAHLDKSNRAKLREAWEWECSQDAARHRAESEKEIEA